MKNTIFVLISEIRGLLFLLLWMIALTSFTQDIVYEIDLTNTSTPQIKYDDLKAFSGTSPDGTTLGVNNRYFTKNGKPWFPLMGEFHFNRYPRQYWEEEIIKMKNGGLSIVATYIFWNAHENPQGIWNWSGNEDLRFFVELCRKHGMYVWLRIGSWSHGEQLFGGHPLWIRKMRGKRSNNKEYLDEAKKLYNQIGKQVSDLFFQEGGPIIGIQLENEYATGDINHIGTLKKMALDAGMKPVYFTITGNSVFHEDKFEAIPLQGGYPYRGWERGGGKATKDFLYGNDQWILTDALMKYATAQPLCRFDEYNKQWLFLTRVEGMDVELAFDAATVKEIKAIGWDKQTSNGMIYLTPNRGGELEITSSKGMQTSIVLLSRAEAENSWRTNINGREILIIRLNIILRCWRLLIDRLSLCFL